MSGTMPISKPKSLYTTQRQKHYHDEYMPRSIVNKAIIGESDSIVVNPTFMEVGKFYLGETDDRPYLYRKTNNDEIEVYGFSDR